MSENRTVVRFLALYFLSMSIKSEEEIRKILAQVTDRDNRQSEQVEGTES